MKACKSLLFSSMLLLGGCTVWPETPYFPTADTGYSHCGTNWIFNNPNVAVEMEVFAREQLELFMWFNPFSDPNKMNADVSANLQDIQLKSSAQTYSPQVIQKRVYKSCSPSCNPEVEISSGRSSLNTGLYVALFPKEIEKLETFTVILPPLLIQGTQVNLAPITFTKTFKLVFCH